MVRVKIVGAGGYGGVGACEILSAHPEARLAALVDVENIGTPFSAIYPHLQGVCDQPIVAADDPSARDGIDVVFMATPDRVGMKLADAEIRGGAKVIDYSGDFRFNTGEAYAEYARRLGLDTSHMAPQLLARSAYGLGELHRATIRSSATVVGNPGCFAVSCILGLAPALREGLVEPTGIICDCKTGVSGAGKKPSPTFHYPARYDQMNAYKLAGHQHVCEIERELGLLAGASVVVTFTSQVVPVCRGIMSTLYGRLVKPLTEKQAFDAYSAMYAGEPFVRVHPSTAALGSMQVRGSNRCNLVVSVDARNGLLRVVSYIDNLVKGQAGSAVQNMNLLFGLPETMGLERPPMFP